MNSGVIIIHHNAQPHSADATQRMFQQFQWYIFDHPAYSHDLAPSDFNLFPELKKWLGRQCWETNKELQDIVKTYFSSLAINFYELKWYDKCFNLYGVYVKK